MKKKLMALTFSLLLSTAISPAQSATFSEQSGDNERITSAQSLINLDESNTINGSLTAIPFDADLFTFSLQAGSTLSVTINDFTFDTQLFLFSAGGFGITGNDNSGNIALNPSFSFTASTDGIYYLGITGSNYDPVDSAGNFIFSDNPTGNFALTSPESLAGWSKRDPFDFDPVSGNYTINLSVTPVPIPEPSGVLGLLALGGCYLQVARKRKAISE
jgi:hypothetical protein